MSEIQKLLEIMAQLRNPEGGCPWDIEQDFSTIAPYTIEEAYEVADAIARKDMGDLRGTERHSEIGLEMWTRHLGPAAPETTRQIDRQPRDGQ